VYRTALELVESFKLAGLIGLKQLLALKVILLGDGSICMIFSNEFKLIEFFLVSRLLVLG
jgi:hypothetical protein